MELPKKTQLCPLIIDILKENNTEMTTAAINAEVIKRLSIPEELLQIEDANCTGSEFSYRMRWARTELKSKNLIRNKQRGIWELVK